MPLNFFFQIWSFGYPSSLFYSRATLLRKLQFSEEMPKCERRFFFPRSILCGDFLFSTALALVFFFLRTSIFFGLGLFGVAILCYLLPLPPFFFYTVC